MTAFSRSCLTLLGLLRVIAVPTARADTLDLWDVSQGGISHRFTLYGWGGSAFDVLLYDFTPSYGNPPLYNPDGPAFNVLNLWAEPLAMISTNRWRAEFVQLADLGGNNDGPRIVELDGFSRRLPGNQVPGPSLLSVLGLGAAGLIAQRVRRRAR